MHIVLPNLCSLLCNVCILLCNFYILLGNFYSEFDLFVFHRPKDTPFEDGMFSFSLCGCHSSNSVVL